MAQENNIFKAQQIGFSESFTEQYFFLMFPIKICLKNRSAPVTVSMVTKYPPLSGKNKDIISNLLVSR